MTPPLLSSYDACRAAGITYRQLDYWVHIGLLTPSIQNSGGSGCPRRWSEVDVCRARAIGLLMRLSAKGPKFARRAAEALSDPPSGTRFLVIGADGLAWAPDANGLAQACARHGPDVLVLDLTSIAADVRRVAS